MILFLNSRITDARISSGLYGKTSKVRRIDVFKYCLSSLSVLNPLISKVVLNVELAEEFRHQQDEINDYINSLFPKDKLVYKTIRSNHYSAWKEDCDLLNSINDNVIWYCGNDDHIFLDSTLSLVKNGVEILEQEEDPMSSIYYSHWPEIMRLSTHLNADLDKNKNFLKFRWGRYDSIQIVRKERFNEYWSIPSVCGVNRSDELMYGRPEIISTMYCPTKEIVRHFDGYAHVGYMNNSCPFLSIPHGFFEKNIKIRYGYDKRIDGWININPAANNFITHDPADSDSVDYKWCLEDIPLFWKDKIKEIDINPSADLNFLKQKRNEFFCTKPIESCVGAYSIGFSRTPPLDWFSNHII